MQEDHNTPTKMIDQNKPECNHEEWIKCDGCLAPDMLNTCQEHVRTVHVEPEENLNLSKSMELEPTESWEEEYEAFVSGYQHCESEGYHFFNDQTENLKAFIKAQRDSEYWRGFQEGKEKIAKLLGSFNPNTHG